MAGAVKREAGEIPALCPQLWAEASAKSGTCLGPSSVSSAGSSRGAWAVLPLKTARSLC